MRLFDQDTLRKLETLTLAADSVRVGIMKGDRRSRKRGTSIEFADYRDYAQGDDLRRIDWNIFARLERPLIKLTEEEEDLAVHILVDTSDSMNWPRDDVEKTYFNKLRYAMMLAGGLSYVALITGDLVQVTLLDSDAGRSWGPFRGRQNGWPLIQFLEANYETYTSPKATSPRATALDVALREYALRARRPGLLFLLSDLLSPNDFRAGMTALRARGYQVALLQLLSPDEIAPDLTGDLRLIDVETGAAAEVTLDPMSLEDYAARLKQWQEDISTYCSSQGIHFTPVSTAFSWEKFILQSLRQEGVVR